SPSAPAPLVPRPGAMLARSARPDLRVRRELLWRGVRAHGGRYEDGEGLGEAEHDVRIVLDEQHGDLRIEPADNIEDQVALGRRYASGRFVEQKELRPLGEGERDLDQALAPIWQLTDRLERVVGERQGLEMAECLVDHRLLAAHRPPQVIAGTGALANHEAQVLEHGQS